MKRSTNLKVFIMSLVMALIFVVVGANIFIVSVLGYHLNSGTDIEKEINGIHEVSNVLHGERGKIVDHRNTVLAEDVIRYTLDANIDETRFNSNGTPAHVDDKEGAASIISSIIGASYEFVLDQLNSEANQVEFGFSGKYLTNDQKSALEAAKIPGLGFTQIRKREYPNRTYDSKLIGNTTYAEDTKLLTGSMGLEELFNEALTGHNGMEKFQEDRDGYKLQSTETIREEAVNGDEIKLTINALIQYQLEESLKGIVEDPGVKAKSAWGIVTEAKTGRILGWGEYPGFDPNNPDNVYQDRVSQWTYEPGSTMKTFSVAAAVEKGTWSDTEIFDSGPFYVGDGKDGAVRLSSPTDAIHTITNAGEINYGRRQYDFGYAMSSNVMIAELMTQKLTHQEYIDSLRRLQFFKPLDIDGISGVNTNDGNSDISVLAPLTQAFGQGLTVTMTQMAQAYSSVMTDGTVKKPYVIDSIRDGATGEITYQGKTEVVERAYSPETAAHMRDLMRLVVTDGSAKRFANDEVNVIGKTGTAQMVVEGESGYSPTQYIFSSALGFPYEDPEVIVYTAYVAKYGHDVDYSAVHVNKIVNTAISELGLGNTTNTEVITEIKAQTINNYVNENTSAAIDALTQRGFVPIVIGNGSQVLKQFPTGGSRVITGERVMIYTGGDTILMPDMIGWSYKEVTSFWSLTGISVEISGAGYVKEQEIPIGTPITTENVIRVKLQ